MALVEMIMPKMGESIMEATILSWLKKEGDTIEQDESVLEVATDKVDTEVPATHAGILKEILAKDGEVVEVGKTIAIIATDTEESSNGEPGEPIETKQEEIPEPVLAESSKEEIATSQKPSRQAKTNGELKKEVTTGRFYSPLVLNIAREEQIALQELETIPGSGKDGRVTKKDILSYVNTRQNVEVKESRPVISPSISPSLNGNDEIIEMDRMRKIIAERMVESKHTSPHVTSFVEADVTNIVTWRNRIKEEFEKREGEKITFTPIFVEAIVKAIRDFPMINISVDGTKIIRHGQINIGIAVALPSGNLIVPVIKNADNYNLIGLSKQVNDLARKARENKLLPDDLSGGTYTISNVGSFGNLMGTPIIMQPQVAIMAVGAITKKPAVIETPQGDLIGIRHKMFLSHAYDHRVVDGALGGKFVKKVADYLENFDIDRVI